MDNKFDYLKREKEIYENWEKSGYFKTKIDKTKKPFTISMPPPNVTAKLHIGHALDNTVQDVLIRYNRLKGVPTLWIPGTDHASIATEVKVVEKLKKEGISKSDLGREGFLKEAWQWKEKYGGEITSQIKKLGCSCDWSNERFTMDEKCTNAVLEVFIRLYNKGLIYKGNRLINWCPTCKTSISETEVDYETLDSHFWHIKYPIKDTNEYVIIATTRPETMLGDVAIAVNPSDDRYKHLVGKQVLLPLVNKYIPIIADYYVDKEFGSGVVKITPAHDPNDYEVGIRHNLEIINIMNEDASLNENALKYSGMDRFVARKEIINDLEKQGFLIKTEPHTHNVGTCYRCHSIIEPYMSNQWFVKMDDLVKPAIDAVKNGEINFIPKRFEKNFFNWMENTQDWCISRQLWWGHRIPAYTCKDCGNVVVSKEIQKNCNCGGEYLQDEDTLDTWFSSALWPFSVLGWPDNNEELDYFFPNSVLVTAYDIITFWVSKMIFSSLAYTDKVPFEYVYIHGLVRDSQGRKMSKSLGNGVDPLEVIKEYGCDALRFSLIQNISAGNDIRYMTDKVEAARNFSNKLWNAGKFINRYISELNVDNVDSLLYEDKWILTKLNNTITSVTKNMDKFEIGVAIQQVYDFIWLDFCDWYIEMVKPRLYNKEGKSYISAIWTLNYTFIQALKLLHPFMPFITEEIYQNLKHDSESIMISKLPETKYDFEKETNTIDIIKELITQIRNEKVKGDIPNSKLIDIKIYSNICDFKGVIDSSNAFLKKLAGIDNIEYYENNAPITVEGIAIYLENITAILDLSSAINKEGQLVKLNGEKQKLQKELDRANSMLSNEAFLSKAPKGLVDAEKSKLLKYRELIQKVETSINSIN